MTDHIIHLAVKPRLEPRLQAAFFIRQVDAGEADRIEAKRKAEGADALLDCRCGRGA